MHPQRQTDKGKQKELSAETQAWIAERRKELEHEAEQSARAAAVAWELRYLAQREKREQKGMTLGDLFQFPTS